MSANVRTYETFVPCPKVIVVKWTSEHPEYFKNDQDLYEYQVWKFTLTIEFTPPEISQNSSGLFVRWNPISITFTWHEL